MDYEKLYNEALKRAKGICNVPDQEPVTIARMEYLFPELKESDDEKIRKELIQLISCMHDKDPRKKDWLDWLEKQGKRDARYENLEELLEADTMYQMAMNDAMVEGAKTKAMNALSELEIGKLLGIEKQGEKKPTEKQKEINYAEEIKKCKDNPLYFFDKYVNIKLKEQKPIIVEPKFKVDDWIVNNENGKVSQIKKIVYDESGYGYDHTNGWFHSVFEKDYHLWTIQDAKNGDVLYSLDSKQPFIFKHRKPNEQAAVYCGINTYGKFFIGNTKDCVITTDKYIPADKSQRDLLFQKIKEAGYQWDAKNKELKLLISNGGDFESNNSKQKPTWSDEDEEILKNLIDYFSLDDGLRLPTEETIDWLKSLKERLS